MTAEQWTTVLTAGPMLLAIIGGAWSLSARLTGLGSRLDALGGRIDGLERETKHDFAGIKGTLSTLMKALVTSKALPEGATIEAALAPWHQQIERERQHTLDPEELNRFEQYYRKVQNRQPLEQWEFQDYQTLADKLYRDRPNDPGIGRCWAWEHSCLHLGSSRPRSDTGA